MNKKNNPFIYYLLLLILIIVDIFLISNLAFFIILNPDQTIELIEYLTESVGYYKQSEYTRGIYIIFFLGLHILIYTFLINKIKLLKRDEKNE